MASRLQETFLRELFEKGVDTVGQDWRSFPLWDLYFTFEALREGSNVIYYKVCDMHAYMRIYINAHSSRGLTFARNARASVGIGV